MSKLILPFMLILTITGCATTDSSQVGGERSTQDRIGHAFISPLNDLNIVQTNIPPIISDALKNPYQIPDDTSCNALAENIHKLDTALGADLDAAVPGVEKTLTERGGEFIQDEAIGSIERTISGVIPFRSWIRKFSGAEKHSKDLTAAIAAGVVRRAFLKGLGEAHGCEPPAAPLKHPFVSELSCTAAVLLPTDESKYHSYTVVNIYYIAPLPTAPRTHTISPSL